MPKKSKKLIQKGGVNSPEEKLENEYENEDELLPNGEEEEEDEEGFIYPILDPELDQNQILGEGVIKTKKTKKTKKTRKSKKSKKRRPSKKRK